MDRIKDEIGSKPLSELMEMFDEENKDDLVDLCEEIAKDKKYREEDEESDDEKLFKPR